MHMCLSIGTLAGLRHVAIGNLASYVHNRYHDFNMYGYSYMHGLTFLTLSCNSMCYICMELGKQLQRYRLSVHQRSCLRWIVHAKTFNELECFSNNSAITD